VVIRCLYRFVFSPPPANGASKALACRLPRTFDPTGQITVQIYLTIPTFLMLPFITPITTKIALFRMNRGQNYSPIYSSRSVCVLDQNMSVP
jgi:hypothetical protein